MKTENLKELFKNGSKDELLIWEITLQIEEKN